ncbi:MAG: hypothetical protein JSU07_13350 [Bacteroidetes bacterium]|nr:hypothetical protein [Bacteroidota bacterium]
MKKIITSVFILSILSTKAQSISTSEEKESFSIGSQNCISTTLYENTASTAIDGWKKALKNFKYEKIKDSKNEVFGDNILVKDWGNNPVDFYTKFVEDKKSKSVKMYTAVDLGGTYLSSSGDKDKYRFVEKMIKDFAINQSKEPMQEMLNASQKQLSKFEDEQKSLEKKNANFKSDINDYTARISKNEGLLATKEGEITKKKAEVDVQRKVVEASSGAVKEQTKASQKIYDKLASELKSLESDKKDLKNDIEKYKGKIKDTEKDIKKNEENQSKKKEEIEKQKKLVDENKNKLESIK